MVRKELRAVEAIEPLYKVFHVFSDENNDWAIEEFPQVVNLIGPPALPVLFLTWPTI